MFFALLAVIALIGLCAVAARKAGLISGAALTRKRRLALVETMALDARRRAVIIRCDGAEHLLILGAGETVVARDLPEPAAGDVAASPNSHPRPPSRAAHGGCCMTRASLFLASTFSMLLAGGAASAQSVTLDLGAEGGLSAQIIQLVLLLTILSLAPSILIMMTSFVRIAVVLSLLRTAIGIQQSPPNPVIIALALFLTFFVMAPTFSASYEAGVAPFMKNEAPLEEAMPKAIAPMKAFMLTQTREKDLALFFDLAKIEPTTPEATPLHIVTPAFMISELRRAFEIGFLIFIPFLIIDMAISSILMAMGMLMLPPIVISLPFKLIFFVLIDGWRLIAGSLVQSFGAS